MEAVLVVLGVGALVGLLVFVLVKDARRERDKHRAARSIIERDDR